MTVQNTTGVNSVISIKPKDILKQILFTCQDNEPDAIKIGMLHSTKVIKVILDSLKKIKVKKIVLDPVMVVKSGTKLISNSAINTLKNLFDKAYLITPNIPEAEVLTNMEIKNINDMVKAGEK